MDQADTEVLQNKVSELTVENHELRSMLAAQNEQVEALQQRFQAEGEREQAEVEFTRQI
jgi:uncharacterized protein YukE